MTSGLTFFMATPPAVAGSVEIGWATLGTAAVPGVVGIVVDGGAVSFAQLVPLDDGIASAAGAVCICGRGPTCGGIPVGAFPGAGPGMASPPGLTCHNAMSYFSVSFWEAPSAGASVGGSPTVVTTTSFLCGRVYKFTTTRHPHAQPPGLPGLLSASPPNPAPCAIAGALLLHGARAWVLRQGLVVRAAG